MYWTHILSKTHTRGTILSLNSCPHSVWDGVGIGVCATEIVIVLNIIEGRGKDSIKWVLSMLVYILSCFKSHIEWDNLSSRVYGRINYTAGEWKGEGNKNAARVAFTVGMVCKS